MKKVINIVKKGTLNKRESIESIRPPLPRINVPESLILALLLNVDSTKSPILAITAVTRANTEISVKENRFDI
jgi:hypothetical protein